MWLFDTNQLLGAPIVTCLGGNVIQGGIKTVKEITQNQETISRR